MNTANTTIRTLKDAAVHWTNLDDDAPSEVGHNAVLALESAANAAMCAGATRAEVLRTVGEDAAEMLRELI